MSKLLSRSKHEELESNSALYIKNQEERIAENIRKRNLRNLVPAALFLPPSTVPSCSPCSPTFHALLFLLQFSVFLLSTLVVITYVWIVWYFTCFVRLYKPFVYIVKEQFFML